MGTRGTRSIFVAALCAGVAMVGLSVHGLVGIDGELQQSAFAARQTHTVDYQSVHVSHRYGGCDKTDQTPARTRT
jgi:hypothetical protein